MPKRSTKTTRLLKSLKSRPEIVTPIGTDIILPNYSGVKKAIIERELLALNDLSDVNTSGVVTSDFLQFDGTNWLDFDLLAAANTWAGVNTFSDVVQCSNRIDMTDNKKIRWGANVSLKKLTGFNILEVDGDVDFLNDIFLNLETTAGFVKNSATTGKLSGGNSIDISDDTNLSATVPLILTGDVLSIDPQDNEKIEFGVGNDGAIYSDGTDMVIVDSNDKGFMVDTFSYLGAFDIPRINWKKSALSGIGAISTSVIITESDGGTDPKFEFVDNSGTIKGRISMLITTATMNFASATGGYVFDQGVIINEGGNDSDFRVESDTTTHMIFVDASTDRVAFNGSNQEAMVTVNADVSIVSFAVKAAANQGTDNYILLDSGDNVVWSVGENGRTLTTGLRSAIVAKTANYTATVDDHTIICGAGNQTFTVTLPAVSQIPGTIFNIKNIGTGTITVDGNKSETIDGGTTATLTAQYESITIQNDGTEWWIL